MKVKLKKPLEVPSHIQAFIDRVVASDSPAESLGGFSWVYDKVSDLSTNVSAAVLGAFQV